MSSAIPAAAAARLWQLYGWSSIRELVLEDLAFARGVVVVEDQLVGMEARLVRQGERGLIRVRADIPELGRKRFAVAHELGHWELHRKISQVLPCTSQDLVAKYKASPPEIQANAFAAELFMPEHLVTPRLASIRPTREAVVGLANEFDTSLTATAIRCVELSDDYWALIASEKGKVRWWRASQGLEDKLAWEPGTPVPKDSVAADCFAGRVIPTRPQQLPSQVWLLIASTLEEEGEEEFEADVIMEQVIEQPAYGQVLSLLWVP